MSSKPAFSGGEGLIDNKTRPRLQFLIQNHESSITHIKNPAGPKRLNGIGEALFTTSEH